MARKGELSPATVNRKWPHQVALPAEFSASAWTTINRMLRDVDHSPRGHSVVYLGDDPRYRDKRYVVYCFRDAETAAWFKRLFQGIDFDLRDKGTGTRWFAWTPKDPPVI